MSTTNVEYIWLRSVRNTHPPYIEDKMAYINKDNMKTFVLYGP